MTIHIKKIMDSMLILTVLSYYFTGKSSEQFYTQVKNLVGKGYNNILIDFTNVDKIDNKVIDILYELHKLLIASGGSMKVFGVNHDVSEMINKSQFGYLIPLQTNEIIDVDMMDMLFHKQVSFAS